MRVRNLHSWDLEPKAAVALQRQLAARVDDQRRLGRCDVVAGSDVSYDLHSDRFYAGVVVFRLADGAIIERRCAIRHSPFPYVPGLLSFREAPALLEAFGKVESRIDAVMIDGHGYSHPRRFGIACHVGVWLNRPTIGCAKTRLTGQAGVPDVAAGSTAPLVDKGETIGQMVRTRTGVAPVFASVGHRIDLPGAVKVILATCRGYRLPEPQRQAHLYVNALRRGSNCEGGSLDL
jgi:deoxyribonuclease V